MKTISISINCATAWGQSVNLLGSIAEIGNWDEQQTKELSYNGNSIWSIDVRVPKKLKKLEFRFYIAEGGATPRAEYGTPHAVYLSESDTAIRCIWQEKGNQKYFATSMFYNSIFRHDEKNIKPSKELLLIVDCIHIEKHQELVLSGAGEALGNWAVAKALPMVPYSFGKWCLQFDAAVFGHNTSYKYAIRDKQTKKIVEWEEGENRITHLRKDGAQTIVEERYKKEWINWKASGVAIPIFSLRSKDSFGIGEFSDLTHLVDWAANAKMKVIQTLPINDTTATFTWHDSYPYNAISTYALHPIYLGLHKHPLLDKAKNKSYLNKAKKLNQLDVIDYTQTMKLKMAYISDLFCERGNEVLESEAFKVFFEKNKDWLFPYGCFCYLRDKYKTAKIKDWKMFSTYNNPELELYVSKNIAAKESADKTFFTQYLLHQQLTEAKEYAYTKGVVLKGDIPIGISPNSVEAWTEPHLFNMDSQTGAPPDDFSVNGQNWGFPTYNWAEMKKDNYWWWTRRFRKMADYFDAYRIDHILGFFRIWEIPLSSVHGLLGYFSPAMPLSTNEIAAWGLAFNVKEMTTARIHQLDLSILLGAYWTDISEIFLEKRNGEYFYLKPEFDTQRKIKDWFDDKTKKAAGEYLQQGLENEKVKSQLQSGLYDICNEVLFVCDKSDPEKFHPRISLQYTFAYKRLDEHSQWALNRLYDDYFFHRHSAYWREEAMGKLPTLANATDMLVCGEDLGMVPECVPSVMNDLQILSLEIERMPKQSGLKYGDLQKLPYLSVATTSTHDMTPIRMWWREDAESTQGYYNTKLGMEGEAPQECNTTICNEIIKKHLESPAMLAILPLQDWLSVSDKLRRKNADDERINVPANAEHNWNYRMHLYLEDLVKETEFSDMLRYLNAASGR